MLDFNDPDLTEVTITDGNKGMITIHININGICRLRVQTKKAFRLDDKPSGNDYFLKGSV
jgi:hypothetical protein